ncbi:CsbD family protein [Nonomuraea sp. NEAU-A123]|uniref:CsbD family protein n=1 Tax=Nonomuraea sp. NEAU-A123 TaxID=2839649 RepID=UPI001BE48867|nr:CsbD family protein [Nonomuraea sp. NEAU-A123]MBT2235791.1 CsbD family protein [Nonomuraea sp. NEAU-A123]
MSLGRKIRDRAQVVKGWARQRLGRATGNQRLQAEGKTDRVVGNLKQAGGKAKDAFKR